VEYACLDPIYDGSAANSDAPASSTSDVHGGGGGRRLLACGEFVEDALRAGSCSLVTMAGDPVAADFAAEAHLRRRGCRATVFTPGGELPAALKPQLVKAAPGGGGGEGSGGSGSGGGAPAVHVRAYVGPVTALLSDPPVLAMLQALRMAAAAGRQGGGAARGRAALEADGSDDDVGAAPSDLVAAAGAGRGPPARHTLLHVSCGGCEWCARGGGGQGRGGGAAATL
jgi:hypothetical protein